MSARMEKENLLVRIREKHGNDIVSMSDLEHPTSDFMMRYFARVVGDVGFDIERMINHEVFQSLPQADSYRDVLPYTRVYMAVKKFCPILKCLAKFSILSLMDPKPADIYYVSVMDDFYNFYHQRISNHLMPRLQDRDSMKELIEVQMQRITELQHQLNDRAAARSKRVMEQAQVERQIQELVTELEELQLQEQQLETEVAEQERVLKEVRLEVEGNLLQQEQMEEQQEAHMEVRALRQELQQLNSRHAVQNRELAEKCSALQEKASRQRFLEDCIVLEAQATEAVADLVEQAALVEKQKRTLQESKTKMELVLRDLEVKVKTKNNLEERKAALKEDTAIQTENIAKSKKAMKDLDRNIQDPLNAGSKHQQDILSLKDKIKCVEEKLLQKDRDMSTLDQMFQKEHDKLCEKADCIYGELSAATEQRLQEEIEFLRVHSLI